jgi:hypothetical protein
MMTMHQIWCGSCKPDTPRVFRMETTSDNTCYFNYWVMHPVARVSIKYWNNLRTQQSIFSARFYYALLTLHVSAPFGGHLQVIRKHKKYLRQSLYI